MKVNFHLLRSHTVYIGHVPHAYVIVCMPLLICHQPFMLTLS